MTYPPTYPPLIDVGNVNRICVRKSCWRASLALQHLFPIIQILLFPALFISGIHKVLGIIFKGG